MSEMKLVSLRAHTPVSQSQNSGFFSPRKGVSGYQGEDIELETYRRQHHI
jgi:hypothetical protein